MIKRRKSRVKYTYVRNKRGEIFFLTPTEVVKLRRVASKRWKRWSKEPKGAFQIARSRNR